MNEALRLAAWLDANAKHMKYDDERIQMHKAARMIRGLEKEVRSDLEALQKAHEMLSEMKKMLIEVSNGQLSEQETIRAGTRITLPVLWR